MEVYRSLGHNDENWLDIIKTELSHNNLIKIKHGSYEKWVLMNYTANLDLLGDIESISIKGNDVSYLIESNSIKEFYSERDQLTGLVNQYGMFDIIKQMKHVNSAVAFFVEVLNFTEISNYYGHNIGDKLIKSVVNELKKTVSKECLIVRYTESKFVLLCSGIKINKESLNLKINKLKEFIKSSYKIENLDLQVDKRIGYAIYPEDTNNFEDLVSLSSLALRNSISNSSIEITRFTPDMLKTLKYNVELGNKLREALDKESIEVFFQKAINCSTDEVFIIEELSRWYDKDLGYIPPLEYFKIAKESNQLDRLDRYMVKKSLESFVKLRLNKEYTKSKITINIAPATLLDVNFFDYFNKIVDEMEKLEKEIVPVGKKVLKKLKELKNLIS
jgi:diguanylate cyclase (GGDEF)-like protein